MSISFELTADENLVRARRQLCLLRDILAHPANVPVGSGSRWGESSTPLAAVCDKNPTMRSQRQGGGDHAELNETPIRRRCLRAIADISVVVYKASRAPVPDVDWEESIVWGGGNDLTLRGELAGRGGEGGWVVGQSDREEGCCSSAARST